MFNTITLLITHYNRSHSLARLLQTFKFQDIQFKDIVVSDDGSNTIHLEKLRELKNIYCFRLITTLKNGGLANNINKGQDAIITPYTLYIQEDFEPKEGYKKHLENAVNIMNDRSDIDMVRFYAYFKYPYLTPYTNGFSQMNFKIWYIGYRKFHAYSDHPHLRRNNFFEKFGKFQEGIKSDRAEFLMALSFLKNKGIGMFYTNYNMLFKQLNSEDEPSTVNRSPYRTSNNWAISFARTIYRNVKHTWEYFS